MTSAQLTRLGVCMVLLFAGGSTVAQQTVYKWTDEDGVIHFGEAPPAGVEAQAITTDAAPPPPPAQKAAPAGQGPELESAQPRATAESAAAPIAEQTPASEMSLAELDARCEAARETRIAPLREAEIESCKADRRNDPAYCETFNADFGEGGRTVSGAMRPRMFDDLPECVEALQERNRRPR